MLECGDCQIELSLIIVEVALDLRGFGGLAKDNKGLRLGIVEAYNNRVYAEAV